MPNIQHPMWYTSELQNKCDTNSIETCSANANCMINDIIGIFLYKGIFLLHKGQNDLSSNHLSKHFA